jgi:hypothetical protein
MDETPFSKEDHAALVDFLSNLGFELIKTTSIPISEIENLNSRSEGCEQIT